MSPSAFRSAPPRLWTDWKIGEHNELANLAAFLVSDGGGASTLSMLDWTDEQWEAIRPKKKW